MFDRSTNEIGDCVADQNEADVVRDQFHGSYVPSNSPRGGYHRTISVNGGRRWRVESGIAARPAASATPPGSETIMRLSRFAVAVAPGPFLLPLGTAVFSAPHPPAY